MYAKMADRAIGAHWLVTTSSCVCMICIPIKTVDATTVALPKNNTKVPTELIAATLSMLLVSNVKAFLAALQKLYP